MSRTELRAQAAVYLDLHSAALLSVVRTPACPLILLWILNTLSIVALPLGDVAVGVALAHGLRHNDRIGRHVGHCNTRAHDVPEHALIVIERIERDIGVPVG
eukprot:scaffold124129_cov63-Phaeocystis_antarctica.AAC.1